MAEISVRCPTGPRNLFARVDADGNWNVACSSCRRTLRMMGASDIKYVVHKYSPDGDLLDTYTVLEGEET